jgi:hypothetical protein
VTPEQVEWALEGPILVDLHLVGLHLVDLRLVDLRLVDLRLVDRMALQVVPHKCTFLLLLVLLLVV